MAAENSKGLVHGVEYPNFEAVVCESLAEPCGFTIQRAIDSERKMENVVTTDIHVERSPANSGYCIIHL